MNEGEIVADWISKLFNKAFLEGIVPKGLESSVKLR